MKKVFVWKNAFVCLLGVLLTFALYQHFWAKRISAQSTTTTRILIPLYTPSGTPGESFLFVENTSMDPYGTTPSSGSSCNVDLYYGGTHYGPAVLDGFVPGQVTAYSATAIESYLVTSLPSSALVYMFLTCNFPYAHAQAEIVNSSGGITSVIPGYIVPPNRSFSTGPEQLLQ